MQEVLDKILALLQSAPNQMLTWDEVKSQLDYREQQQMPNAIRFGRSNGSLHRHYGYNKEVKEGTLTLRFGPKPEASQE